MSAARTPIDVVSDWPCRGLPSRSTDWWLSAAGCNPVRYARTRVAQTAGSSRI